MIRGKVQRSGIEQVKKPTLPTFAPKVAKPAPKKQKSVPQRDGRAKQAARYAKSMV